MTELAILKILLENTQLASMVGNDIHVSFIPQDTESPSVLINVDDLNRTSTKDLLKIEKLNVSIVSITDDLEKAKTMDKIIYDAIQDLRTQVLLENGYNISISRSFLDFTRSEFNMDLQLHTIISNYKIYSSYDMV